jgi:hypothetical protein
MARIILILFTLSLFGCSEGKHGKQITEKKTEQIELLEGKTKDTEAEFETKLKTEYEKRFGVPISDFELSITGLSYRYPQISLIRTTNGIFARYRNNTLELELDIGEWLDFVNALHKCNIQIKKKYEGTGFNDGDNEARELKILSSSEEFIFLFNLKYHNSDWVDFMKLMDVMTARIKKEGNAKLEIKLKAEYEKRFGVPMTDFEFSISQVYFQYYGKPSPLEFTANRTMAGASFIINDRIFSDIELELGIDEWLDFVNVLRKCNINEWEKKHWGKKRYIENTDHDGAGFGYRPWHLTINSINFSDKDRHDFDYIDGYPPNWNEFIQAMYDFVEKMKEKAKTEKVAKD